MIRSLHARLLSALAAGPVLAFLLLASGPALADHPHPWGIWTQEPASPIMDRLETLHNWVTGIIVIITIVVFVLMGYVMVKFNAKANPKPSTRTHNAPLEVVWTIIPVIILIGIAFPSFSLLYAEDHAPNPKLTLKVTGHQWYWSYGFPDYKVAFDANLKQDADLKDGDYRLLSTDVPLVLPIGVDIAIQITADDVIHSWGVPAFGVKLDAMPGRLNETWTRIEREGTYFGQCSQLCGINHGFMPIEVQAVTPDKFEAWLEAHKATKKFSTADSGAIAVSSILR
jgi:cytochrome c oxidase subunit 2